MTEFRLHCLGHPALQIDGDSIRLEMRKSLALLIYLRLTARASTREFLATLLWPEYDQQHAQASLRRTLASLNKSLGCSLIDTDREKIGLSDPEKISLDTAQFQALAGAERGHIQSEATPDLESLNALEKAVGIYQGDFLEGFNLRDCPEFDEWQSNQREELRCQLAGVLETLTSSYASRGEWEKAIRSARRWVNLDRLDETSQRQLIQLYARTGRGDAAIRQYRELVHLLQEELGQSPSNETQALFEQIQAGHFDLKSTSRKGPPTDIGTSAGQPLIRTKIFTPPCRPNLVSRPRLLDRMDQTAHYPLTLICAPAGYGKTTLLLEWIQHCIPRTIAPARTGEPVEIQQPKFAWLSLDPGDNDPSRFLAYLLAALDNTHPGIDAEIQPLLHSPRPIPPLTILSFLINSLQDLARPLWLILDDYQAIENPAIHECVSFLLEHQPVHLHLVIATRSNPPLPLYRLRARNRLLELRAADLRFSPEEAAAFLNEVMNLSLSIEEVDTLENRTEGWIVGLQMAALSVQGRSNPSAFIREFGGSNRYVLEYLLEEILHRQPPAVQDFLLQTSILDRLCKPLCDAVLENPDCSQVGLGDLEHSNLFVTPLDEIGYWYRYHQLFADLLRARLSQSQPGLVPLLHMRASLWYEEEGLPVPTIHHALAAKKFDRAADLLERFTMDFMERGEMDSLLGFIHKLPVELIQNHPGLCIQYAWVLTFSGQISQVEPWLKQAEDHTARDDLSQQAREIRGSAAIIRGLMADFHGEMSAAIQLARQADEWLPKESYQARSLIPFVLGDGYYAMGRLDQAEQAFEQIRQIGKTTGNLWTNETALIKLAQVKRAQGKLHAAQELYQEAIQLAAEKKALYSGSMGATYIGLSDLQREWNQLDAAYQTARQAIDSMEHWNSPFDRVNGYLSLSRTALAQNDLPAAEKSLEMAEENSRRGNLFQLTWKNLEACRLRLWLARGDLEAVRNWAEIQKADEIEARLREKPDTIAELEGGTLARAFIALGGEWVDKAVPLLKRVAEVSRTTGQIAWLIEADMLLALAYYAAGESAAAVKLLRECLVLSQPEGYLRQYLNEGEGMRRMLEECRARIVDSPGSENQSLSAYISQVLSAFAPMPQSTPAKLAQAELAEPLSSRELEVLGLICDGCSNGEIAEKLTVSLDTVKKHNNRIFGKLGVTSRVQAVIRARKLGLIQESPPSPADRIFN